MIFMELQGAMCGFWGLEGLWVGRIGGWKTPVHQLSLTLFSWFAFVSRTFTQEGVCSVVA